ncbi:hypothetical protein [Actinokineospora sp.]|uniref:hypothetical protein n=1 Tax=Actinokineospora sp. TaxID=1872133 RepID=UPI0040382F58
MSRAQQNSTGRPRLAPAALGLGLAAVLGAVGCSAGQITQTDSQLPAVNGAMAQLGPIAVRDAKLAYPKGGFYPSGSDAPLVLTFVNVGADADELLDVTSTVAEDVDIVGDVALPGSSALAVGTPDETVEVAKSSAPTTPTPTSSAAAPTSTSPSRGGSATSSSAPATTAAPTSSSAKVELGKLEIVLTGVKDKLYAGKTIPVTFVFAKAGSVTVELPIASPTEPRAEHAEGEH